MRFAVAVAAAAAADLVVLLRADQWFGVVGLLALGYLLLASAGAGFVAAHRSALAGALAVFAGAALSAIVQYAGRGSSGGDLGILAAFELQLLTAVVPYAVAGALAGLAGGVLRRRAALLAR